MKKSIRIAVLLSWMLLYFQSLSSQIIADHTVVELYDDIPQRWIDSVKTMLVDIAGESHSEGYRVGMELLEAQDATYQVTTYEVWGTPVPDPSTEYVRLGKHDDVGEEDFYTNTAAINAYKTLITNQNETSNPYDVMGFGWCWDMDYDAAGGTIDPVFNVHWAGSSYGGPEGNLPWGLDAGDVALTGNSVTMDTYLDAVEQYIQHCTDNGYSTTIIFTTGPVDMNAGTEQGFQREIKNDYIRDYVAADETRVLFDYADILCWNDAGEQYLATWDDSGENRDHAQIHPDNLEGGYVAHIGNVGALRLGKAMWWMLARIAGWDGGQVSDIPVNTINLTSEGGVNEILTGETLQFSAEVLPSNATNKDIIWSVSDETGSGTITQQGLFTAISEGIVTIIAAAQDGSGITGTLPIQIYEISTSLENLNFSEIKVYPNPSQGSVYIQNQGQDIDQIVVNSINGAEILNFLPEPGTSLITLDLKENKSGIYVLMICKNDAIYQKKIIILP